MSVLYKSLEDLNKAGSHPFVQAAFRRLKDGVVIPSGPHHDLTRVDEDAYFRGEYEDGFLTAPTAGAPHGQFFNREQATSMVRRGAPDNAKLQAPTKPQLQSEEMFESEAPVGDSLAMAEGSVVDELRALAQRATAQDQGQARQDAQTGQVLKERLAAILGRMKQDGGKLRNLAAQDPNIAGVLTELFSSLREIARILPQDPGPEPGDGEAIPGGKAAGMSPGQFDQVQLEQGVKEEMEHTTDPRAAQEIAMDHLVEDPSYYSDDTSPSLFDEDDPNGENCDWPIVDVHVPEAEVIRAWSRPDDFDNEGDEAAEAAEADPSKPPPKP